MENIRIPYIVKPGTKAMQAAKAWQECVQEFHTAATDFAKKHGAVHFWEDGFRVTGLAFANETAGKVPEWWLVRKKDQGGMFTPFGQSDEAKKIRKAMAALPRKWDTDIFAKRFGGAAEINGKLVFPSLNFFDETVILGVPARDPMPEIIEGCEEILLSQYYGLLTMHKEKKT